MRGLVLGEIRRRWRSAAVIGLVLGLGWAAVLTAAAGARRTDTAYPTLLREGHVESLLVSASANDPGFYGRIADVPGVARTGHLIGAGLIPTTVRKGKGTPLQACSVVSADGVEGYAIDRPNVLEGRLPNPEAADEVLATAKYRDAFGVKVGDQLDVAVDSADPEPLPGEATAADGPIAHVKVVGIGVPASDVVAVSTLDGQPRLLATPAFAAAHLRDPSTWCYDGVAATLDPGADVNKVSRAIQGLAGPDDQVFIQDETATQRDVERAIVPQVDALWLFAAAAALGTLLVVAQLLSRQLRLGAADIPAWRALGATRRQMRLMIAAPSGVTAAVAAAVALTTSMVLSSRFPVGPARLAELHRGPRFDALLHGGGTLLVVAVPLAIGLIAAGLALRGIEPSTRTPLLARLPGRSSAAPVAVGVHLVSTPSRGREAIPVRSALLGTALAITALVMTVTFASGLDDLVSVPARYGKDWDVMVDGVFGPSPAVAVTKAVGRDDAVTAIAGGRYGEVNIDGRRVPTIGLVDLKGTTYPALIAGRAAARDDELVMGQISLRELHKSVGDTVRFDAGAGPHEMRIVGEVAFPRMNHGSFSTLGLGEGALVRADQIPPPDLEGPVPEGIDEADFVTPDGQFYEFETVRFRPGTSRAERARLTHVLQGIAQHDLQALRLEQRPIAIDNYAAVRSTPLVLSLLLGGLAAVTLAHLIVSVVRRRRRDLAVVRALGMTRGQVRRSVVVSACLVAGAALLVGIPLGLAAGRLSWAAFARNLGVVPDLRLPVTALLVIIPAAALGAAVIALAPAFLAARRPPGPALSAE